MKLKGKLKKNETGTDLGYTSKALIIKVINIDCKGDNNNNNK